MTSLFANYRKSLKRPEAEELPDLVLFRPLGYLVVKAVYATNITPNQLSLLSMILGILAGIGFGFGQERALGAGRRTRRSPASRPSPAAGSA